MWLSWQRLRADAHLQGNGITARDVDVEAQTATLGLEYGLSDRLAFNIAVPYVSTRFLAGKPHVGSIVDDGRTHRGATDLRLDLRYKAVDSVIVVTPHFSALVPAREYETLGHAAAGKGMREYAAGVNVGYHAVPISTSLFAAASYQFSYVERIDDEITVDRSNADLQIDYLVTRRLGVRAAAIWQRTHGGLNLPLPPSEAAEHGAHHDQLARANFWHAMVGMGYGITPSIDGFATWSTVLNGVNTHRFDSWSVGVAWRFSTPAAAGAKNSGSRDR